MRVMKNCIKLLKDIMHKIFFKMECELLDAEWRDRCDSCWGLFKPSFYLTHTDEEIERITAETKARIQDLIDQLGD